MNMLKALPRVSVVVIGQNEEEFLENCFKSILDMNYPRDLIEIVYVDSNSTDRSLEIASVYASKVIARNQARPTAGLSFNLGVDASSHDYVQILGGDMFIDRDFVVKAIKAFDRYDNTLAAVEGRFSVPDRGGWEKLISYRNEQDRNYDEHFVDAPGAGLFKKTALYEVNGYDERIKKGQETDLGTRLREAGYKILYISQAQGLNNFDPLSFYGLLKRSLREGFNLGINALVSLKEPKNTFLRNQRKSTAKSVGRFFTLVLALIFAIVFDVRIMILAVLIDLLILARQLTKRGSDTLNYKKYKVLQYYIGLLRAVGAVQALVSYPLSKENSSFIYAPMKGLKGLQDRILWK